MGGIYLWREQSIFVPSELTRASFDQARYIQLIQPVGGAQDELKQS